MKIDENVAVVTGGASGLGEASARLLAAGGAKVAIFYSDGKPGALLAADIGGCFVHADVCDERSISAVLQEAAA